jgi:hypothetical protein
MIGQIARRFPGSESNPDGLTRSEKTANPRGEDKIAFITESNAATSAHAHSRMGIDKTSG